MAELIFALFSSALALLATVLFIGFILVNLYAIIAPHINQPASKWLEWIKNRLEL